MNKIYLLLGSNMGDTKKQLSKAISYIKKNMGEVVRTSALYRTAAWGKADQPDFLNQVIVIESKMTAEAIMNKILDIEAKMGRIRTVKNAARIIDIDILFFNKEILNKKKLTIPHPSIQARRFVLIPLNEIAPQFIHPVLQKTNHQLLLKCADKLDVKKIYLA